MNTLGWYSIGAIAIIFMIFYFVRKVPVYGALCLLAILAFALLTVPLLDVQQPSEWVVAVVGLLLSVFGLLIVRVMLVRSVSLRLLRRLADGEEESVGEDIEGRVEDMRGFKLIGSDSGACNLTSFGRLVGGTMALFYSLFRIAR
jgi:hypothetical protein